MNKIKVAVFFGGKSFEHDVSILTGIQVIQAIDITKYEPFPVYVDSDGYWWTGAELLDTKNYPITDALKSKLANVSLQVGEATIRPSLKIVNATLFGKKRISFDIAFFAFHGAEGESGAFQGLFETSNIAYTGANILSSSVYMSKIATKQICKSLNINVLPETIITKPNDTEFIDIEKLLKNIKISYPLCAKPANLGSSVGVCKVTNKEELSSALLDIFKMDNKAILEPFVENLVEYNIAVMKNLNDEIITSVIESPNNDNTFLSFKDKYLSENGAKKKGLNISAMPSDELIESRRKFAPKLTKTQEDFIIHSAKTLFSFMGATGNPRIDFLSNAKTGEIWLNEVNPIPGAFAFYLWQNSEYNISYTELID
ncbi:MAG: D-alanine--D-alanine ligase, partial [Alphaproteobacteria bacterium]|nr:D-alanine--D-alanine ligase [Alphaproteobacteria bacterium]